MVTFSLIFFDDSNREPKCVMCLQVLAHDARPQSKHWARRLKYFFQLLWNRSEAFKVKGFRIQKALIASESMNGSKDMLNEDYQGALEMSRPCKRSQNIYFMASLAPQIRVKWVIIQKWHDLIQTPAATSQGRCAVWNQNNLSQLHTHRKTLTNFTDYHEWFFHYFCV